MESGIGVVGYWSVEEKTGRDKLVPPGYSKPRIPLEGRAGLVRCRVPPTNSFNKELPGAAPNVPLSREIRLGDLACRVEKRAHAFDEVESDIGDGSTTKPFVQQPTLNRDTHLAQGLNRYRA